MRFISKHPSLTFLCIALIFSSTFVVVAQSGTSTPTAAPSKTPFTTATPASTAEALVASEGDDDTQIREPLPRAYTQEDLAVLVGNVQRPNGFVWLDDYLFAVCNGDWTIYRIDDTTGATITFVFGVQNAHMLYAETTEEGFNLWIPDFDTNRLLLVDQTQTAPVEIASEGLDSPWGIVALDQDTFLISNLRTNNLAIVNRNGELRIALDGLRSPAGLARDGDYIYVANNGSARRAIEWFNINDLAEDAVAEDITQPLLGGLQNASSIILADDGYLYFTFALGTRGVVGRIDPEKCRDGGCKNEDVEIVVFTDLQAPLAGLTITPDMRLYIHTIYRPEIYWVQLYE